jgi:hypothetical protein
MSVGTTENKLKIEITPASAWMITALSRILFIQAETGVFIFSQLFINPYLAYGKMLPNSN